MKTKTKTTTAVATAPRYLPGSRLDASDRAHVLRAYVHRFTRDHKPAWALKPWKCGKPLPVQFASDWDWLEHTLFRVKQNGRLDSRVRAVQSSPTWPDNPEFRT